MSISLPIASPALGCITSAETVIVEEQSVQRVIEGLRGEEVRGYGSRESGYAVKAMDAVGERQGATVFH